MENNIFGKKLKEVRLEKGLTQKQVADVLHVSNQTISFWEGGSREPNLDSLVVLSKFLDVTVDYLLGEN